MKLSYQDKKELRTKIEEQLQRVPEGQMVRLDKEILENLLFDVITVDKETGTKVKLPTWSGEFLKKIDLSQVDFSNVSWCFLDSRDYDFRNDIEIGDIKIPGNSIYDTINTIKISCGIPEKLEKLPNLFVVNYAGTNANIDLTKSFEAIHGGFIEISGCDFTGLDFSHQDLTCIKEFLALYSSLSGTRLAIPSEIEMSAIKSSFDGIDLSSRTISAYGYFYEDTYSLSYCSLHNTGININLGANDSHDDEESQKAMNNDWVGCYVNGKKVLSREEKLAIAEQKNNEYQNYKQSILDSVSSSIDEQVGQIKR